MNVNQDRLLRVAVGATVAIMSLLSLLAILASVTRLSDPPEGANKPVVVTKRAPVETLDSMIAAGKLPLEKSKPIRVNTGERGTVLLMCLAAADEATYAEMMNAVFAGDKTGIIELTVQRR